MKENEITIGQKIGYWTVLKEVSRQKGRRYFQVQCICSTVRDIKANSLCTGNTISCGCYRIKRIKETNTKHGEANKSAEYTSWRAMHERCKNPQNISYKNYGGRGIRVCKRWGSFSRFLKDMGRKPPGTSLDRKDNQGNYTPENCRWATVKEQQSNRQNTILLTFNGVTQCLAAWAEEFQIYQRTIYNRYHAGWPLHEILHGRQSS